MRSAAPAGSTPTGHTFHTHCIASDHDTKEPHVHPGGSNSSELELQELRFGEQAWRHITVTIMNFAMYRDESHACADCTNNLWPTCRVRKVKGIVNNPWPNRPNPAGQLCTHCQVAWRTCGGGSSGNRGPPWETSWRLQEDRAERDFQEMYRMSRWDGWAGWEQWVWVPYPGKGHWMDAAEDWRDKEAARLAARSCAEPTHQSTDMYWCGVLQQPHAFDDDYEAAERIFHEEALVEKWHSHPTRDPEFVFTITQAEPERIHARV